MCAEHVMLAVEADHRGDLPLAFKNYMIALDYISLHLKYEKEPKAREIITLKVPSALLPSNETKFSYTPPARNQSTTRFDPSCKSSVHTQSK